MAQEPSSPVADGRSTPAEDMRSARVMPGAVRAEDIEPYVALQYISRLFKIAAAVVVVALAAEVVTGVALEGVGALLPLTNEVVQGAVLTAVLWGAADVVLLLIDVGHDVRSARVLLGRLNARNAPPEIGRSDEEPGGAQP